MDNLVYSLNATIPLFVLVVLGYIFKQKKLLDDGLLKILNTWVFQVAVPCSLFMSIISQDFYEIWDGSFVLFCVAAILVEIIGGFLICRIFFWEGDRGEFIQGSYRSNVSLLGLSFIENIYGLGNIGSAALMIFVAAILFNSISVILLEVTRKDKVVSGNDTLGLLKNILISILKNHLIWGTVIGIFWGALRIPRLEIVTNSVRYLANTATPLGLIAIGAGLNLQKVKGQIKPAAVVGFFRLIGWAAILIPVAVLIGYGQDKLIAILALIATPQAVVSYANSVSMGHDGVLTSSLIVMTTALCTITLTAWLFLLRVFGLI